MIKRRLSIMVPALNEENNIQHTVDEIKQGLKGIISSYEIFIVDDGSTDRTGIIAEDIAKNNERIRVIHHKNPQGMGYCYKEGLKSANYEYYMYIPGDNQFPSEALAKMVKLIGQTDIINPYVANMHIRPILRQWISATFTHLLNLLFNLNLKYYNGTVIHKTELLKKYLPKSNGHAYQAEILVRLIKSGASYIEVGYDMIERKTGATSAFKFKNIKSVLKAILVLFYDVQMRKNYQTS